MEYVYFIKHKGLSPIKIGRTNDLSKRIYSFNNASPYGIEVIGVIETKDSVKLESIIHKKFNSFRLNGEWFDITNENAINTIMLHNGADYIEARNRFEIGYNTSCLLEQLNKEDYKDSYLHNLISKEYNVDKGFVNSDVLNQKELSIILGVDRNTVKEFLDYIKCEYRTYSHMGKAKKGYKVFLK